jgi:DNA-binding transcriptional ArsR family regulator
MPSPDPAVARRDAALALLRHLRVLDEASGVRHSGIARDVGLLLHEHAEFGLQVTQIAAATGYSGPTIRLVLSRLEEAGAVALRFGRGKARIYRLTEGGQAAFGAYVEAVWDFAARAAVSAAADPSSG